MGLESSFSHLHNEVKQIFKTAVLLFFFSYLTQKEKITEITESFEGVNVSNFGLALKFSGWAAQLFNWESQ